MHKINTKAFTIMFGLLMAACACNANPPEPTWMPTTTPVAQGEAPAFSSPTDTLLTNTLTPQPSATHTPTHMPSLTPSPTQTPIMPVGMIAYVSAGDQGYDTLWLMNADGSEVVAPIPDEQVTGSIFWSPDGSKLAYLSYTGNLDMDTVIGLKLYDLLTGEIKTMQSHQADQFWRLRSWSPNGQYILLEAGTGMNSILKVVDVERDKVASTLDVYLATNNILFSPDSTNLVFVTMPENVPAEGMVKLTTADFLHNQENVIVEAPLDMDNNNEFNIFAWLPDGRILFSWREQVKTGDSWDEKFGVWSVIPNLDEVPQLANEFPLRVDNNEVLERMPKGMRSWFYSFSPDGEWLVYSVRGQDGTDQIYMLSWETGNLMGPLVEGNNPVWRPEP